MASAAGNGEPNKLLVFNAQLSALSQTAIVIAGRRGASTIAGSSTAPARNDSGGLGLGPGYGRRHDPLTGLSRDRSSLQACLLQDSVIIPAFECDKQHVTPYPAARIVSGRSLRSRTHAVQPPISQHGDG